MSRLFDKTMPPPVKDGAGTANRFPLPLAERSRLIESIFVLRRDFFRGGTVDPLWGKHLGYPAWVETVDRMAAGLSSRRLEGVLARLRYSPGRIAQIPRWGMPLSFLVLVQQHSEEVCGELRTEEMNRESRDRVYLRQASDSEWPADARRASISTLWVRVYSARASRSELEDAEALLDELRTVSASWPEAWVGLCASLLGGPKLWYGPYSES